MTGAESGLGLKAARASPGPAGTPGESREIPEIFVILHIMSNPCHISAVIPEYKGAGMVAELVERLQKSLNAITDSYEIILVNDASPDDAWSEIQKACEKDKRVKGINLSRNFGQHYAISAGLSYAKGDWVVVLDCDLQDQPEEISKLYNKALEGYDIAPPPAMAPHCPDAGGGERMPPPRAPRHADRARITAAERNRYSCLRTGIFPSARSPTTPSRSPPQRRRKQAIRTLRPAIQFRVANAATRTARLQYKTSQVLQFRQLPHNPVAHLRRMFHAVLRRHADFIATIVAIQIHRDARTAQPAFAFRADWNKIHQFGKHIANHRAWLRPTVITARLPQQACAHSDSFPFFFQFRHHQSLCSSIQSP